MDSLYKVVLTVGITLCCLSHITTSQDAQMVLTSEGAMDLWRLLVSNQCSSYRGCNLKHTRCKEYPDGCGDHFKNCQCKDGYSLASGICKKFRKVKESCTVEEHLCPALASCTNGKCECPGDVHSDNKEVCGRRYKEACDKNSDCNQQRGNQTCQSSQCMCAPGFEYVKKHGKKCLPQARASCTSSTGCAGGQYCSGTTCQCQTGHKWDEESYRCVGSNAMTGIDKGSECTLNHLHSDAKVCTFGHTCFPCNPSLGLYRCVRFPTSGVAAPRALGPLTAVGVLLTALYL